MINWMRDHKQALVVATCMFALMAVSMGEAMMATGGIISSLFDDDSSVLAAWIWRIGGALTWPVFMWLLLKPHADNSRDAQVTLGKVCIVSFLYGGFGLWIIWRLFDLLVVIVDNGLSFLGAIIALLGIVLPFAYVWGFVALYGFARAKLEGRANDRGWIVLSLFATIIGVYGIGALIYVALAAVSVPIVFVVSPLVAVGADDLAWHVAVDMFAVALSTGNFASQWWAFKCVDEHFDEQAATASAPYAAGPMPSVSPQDVAYRAPVQPSVPTASPVVPSQPVVTAVPIAPAQDVNAAAGQQLPKLVCTCGRELPIDEAYLPDIVPKARFCPNCGAQLLP